MGDKFTKCYDDILVAQEAVRLLAEDINRGKGGREVALVATKLEEALLWLKQARSVSRQD